VLCVENFRLEAMTLEVLQGFLDGGGLSLCWDLAKTYDGDGNRVGRVESFYRRNLARVRQVHLHDIRDGRSHRVIGTGCVDFLRFLPRLAAADVMDYCIEVRPREKAVESLANLRRLLDA
jgi:sugar phosphate isomerase/epimerase